jgi:putative ABC transport system permease protein
MKLMRFSNLLHLYRVRMRRRLVQELLAVVGIAVGVALLFASQIASTSLTGSVEQLTTGIVGQTSFQLTARGPRGFKEDVLSEVQRVSGVKDAAPVLEARVTVSGPQGRRSVDLIGADPRFARLGGALLRHFTSSQLARQRAIALPSPIAHSIGVIYGDEVGVASGARVMRALLGAQLQQSEIGDLVFSPVALAPLPYAQALTGMEGRITRIFVEPRAGNAAHIERELRRIAGSTLNFRPADYDAELFKQAATPTNQSTALFSAFSALVGFLFAFTAMLLTVPQRRRLIADLRVAGHDASVVIQVLLFDALVLGAVGVIVGLVVGDQLSRHLFTSIPGYLSFAFPVGSQRIVSWQSVVIAAGGGLLAACIAVLAPLRDIFSRRPPQYAPPAGSTFDGARWLVGGGVGCLAVTAFVLAVAPGAAILGMATLTLALLLLLPLLMGACIDAFAALRRRPNSAAPVLALAELRARGTRARSYAVAATAAVAVFGSVAIQGAHSDLQRGLDRSAHDIAAITDVWASPGGVANLLGTTPFPSSAARALERAPGIGSVTLFRAGFLDVGARRVWVLAPPRSAPGLVPPSQLVDGNLATATARVRRGGWAVVSKAIAQERGWTVGSTFTLPSPVPTRLRVAALSTNIGWSPGAIVLNADDYARAWGSDDASAIQVKLAPGISHDAGARAVRQALGPGSALAVETAAVRELRERRASRQGLSRLSQIAALVLIAAVLATATAMGGMIWQRRRQLAGLKVDGLREAELWRALLIESVVLLGAGCVIGAVFGLLGQLLISHALANVTGFPVFYSMAVPTAAASLAVVTAVAVAFIAIPGLLAARVRPAVGLQD